MSFMLLMSEILITITDPLTIFQVSHLEPWEKGSRKTAGQTGMCGGVSTSNNPLSVYDISVITYRAPITHRYKLLKVR